MKFIANSDAEYLCHIVIFDESGTRRDVSKMIKMKRDEVADFRIYQFGMNCAKDSGEPANNKSRALWRELNHRNSGLVPEKTDWVPVTKKRLNSAMKRLNIA